MIMGAIVIFVRIVGLKHEEHKRSSVRGDVESNFADAVIINFVKGCR